MIREIALITSLPALLAGARGVMAAIPRLAGCSDPDPAKYASCVMWGMEFAPFLNLSPLLQGTWFPLSLIWLFLCFSGLCLREIIHRNRKT